MRKLSLEIQVRISWTSRLPLASGNLPQAGVSRIICWVDRGAD